MKFLAAVVLMLFLVVTSRPHLYADEEGPGAANYWMTKKLELSQEILAALTLEQFDALAEKADQLKRLSRIEGWARRVDAEEYRRELKRFQHVASALIHEAEEENLDGATLAFHHLTLSCVKCHQHLRSGQQEPLSSR